MVAWVFTISVSYLQRIMDTLGRGELQRESFDLDKNSSTRGRHGPPHGTREAMDNPALTDVTATNEKRLHIL